VFVDLSFWKIWSSLSFPSPPLVSLKNEVHLEQWKHSLHERTDHCMLYGAWTYAPGDSLIAMGTHIENKQLAPMEGGSDERFINLYTS
jgi:hypothetical protein